VKDQRHDQFMDAEFGWTPSSKTGFLFKSTDLLSTDQFLKGIEAGNGDFRSTD